MEYATDGQDGRVIAYLLGTANEARGLAVAGIGVF
jgi:hypothetical protein